MQKTQRNAFALVKKEEAIAVPEPPPQFSHGTVTFDMVPSSAEDLQYELSERATPCPTLTDEQVTGRERTSVGTVISLGFTSGKLLRGQILSLQFSLWTYKWYFRVKRYPEFHWFCFTSFSLDL